MPAFCETNWKLRSKRELNAWYCSVHPRALSLVPRLQRWTFQPMGGRTLQAWEPWPSQSLSGRRSARGRPPTLWCSWLPRTPGMLWWRDVYSPKQLKILPKVVQLLPRHLLRPCVIYIVFLLSKWSHLDLTLGTLNVLEPPDWDSGAVSPPGL